MPNSTLLKVSVTALLTAVLDKEKKNKRKDYTFRRQVNEKPSIIPGCPGTAVLSVQCAL